ncbi:MAG: inositol monophosphatase [Alphaproteobacteria bacterium]|nr:inositol monophosphatase [Alphaproteobacteria bacterium]
MRIDPRQVASIIRDAAETEVLPRFRQLAADERWEKAKGSVVTVADHAAEAVLAHRLGDLLPGARIVGEEAAEANETVFDALEGDDPIWVLDPIDGTANFADGNAAFAMMVALVVGRRTRMGWIHDPVADRTVIAEDGGGAWDGARRLTVADAPPLAAMRGSLGNRLRNNAAIAARFATLSRARCCGQEYLALDAGRLHFALYRNLKPWDHAPGELIHREAGGFAASLEETAYAPRPAREGTLLLAPDRDRWRNIRAVLTPEMKPA